MTYLLMFVLLVISILTLLFFPIIKKNTIGEKIPKLLLVIPSVMAIFTILFTLTLDKPVDIKMVEYSARYIKHYSDWAERVGDKTIFHKDIYYMVYEDPKAKKDIEIEISKNTFLYFSKLWKNKEVIQHPQNKKWHICIVRWNKDPSTALIYSKPEKYINYMNNVLNVYDLYNIDMNLALKNRLFVRYSFGRTVNEDNILEPRQKFVYGINIPDSISRKIGYTSSLNHMFRPLLLVWQNSKKDRTKLQESFWSRGKENEAIFCVGIDDNEIITWSGSFSWDKSKNFENHVLSNVLMPGMKLDVNRYSEYILDGYKKGYWEPIDLDSHRFIQISTENIMIIMISIFIVLINLVTIIRFSRDN